MLSSVLTKRTLLCVMLLTLIGCAHHPRMDNSLRLMKRPDFPEAATCAPDWVEDALLTINQLELEIEKR